MSSLREIQLISMPGEKAPPTQFSSTPRVFAWLGRLLSRPAWQQARALVFDYY